MPQWPHEYTVREWRPDLEREFSAFVELIRRDGQVKPWPRDAPVPRYRHTYLEIDGWEYWSMGAPVRETTVINRALPASTLHPSLTRRAPPRPCREDQLVVARRRGDGADHGLSLVWQVAGPACTVTVSPAALAGARK
jgi:hypothetical protein